MDQALAFARGYERGYDAGYIRGFMRGSQERQFQSPPGLGGYNDIASAENYMSGIRYPNLGDSESKDLIKIFSQAFEEAYRMGFGRGLERGSKP